MTTLTYDALVIGAGNGGLAAALRLAKSNKKVLLVERHLLGGGFATSFIRGRFEFDASLHELCEYGTIENKGEVYELLEEIHMYSSPLISNFCNAIIENNILHRNQLLLAICQL